MDGQHHTAGWMAEGGSVNCDYPLSEPELTYFIIQPFAIKQIHHAQLKGYNMGSNVVNEYIAAKMLWKYNRDIIHPANLNS